MHCVFGTREKFPFITPSLESRLWPYIGGIARENKIKALVVGGTTDHIHALLSLPATMDIAKAIQLIKGGSSKWIHDSFRESQKFAWQEGYGAFSVSSSQVNKTIAYIDAQKEHHRRKSFREEFVEFLDKHAIEYEPRHVLQAFSRPLRGLAL